MVLAEITKDMYGLPQDSRIAYDKIIIHLASDGYIPTGKTPDLFKHTTQPIYFLPRRRQLWREIYQLRRRQTPHISPVRRVQMHSRLGRGNIPRHTPRLGLHKTKSGP